MFRPYRGSEETFAVVDAGKRKTIVASVARCAWLDTADELDELAERDKEQYASYAREWAQWGKADGQ